MADIPVEKSINLVKDEQDLPYYMNDMTGHGTAVADIIHQVCPQAQIYSVKVMDSENRGRLSDVVAGIYWCMEQDVDIINMSFGTNVESDILQKAVEAAAKQGIMMISSAGNGGAGSEVEYPAAFEEVIAVGAVDTSAQKTEESATGEKVELVAPGAQILTKSMLGFETVNSGTSMAAPHVTGAAALIMQQSRYKDAGFIRRVLDKSSNPLGEEDAYGYGLVDVAYALELLSGYEEITEKEHEIASTANAEAAEKKTADEITLGETARDMKTGAKTDAGREMEAKTDERQKSEKKTDALDTLVQTSKPVDTFEDVDYVEGRWAGEDHTEIADQGMEKAGGFTGVEMKIFKCGAAHPDKSESVGGFQHGSRFPEWHGWNGWNGENYIANYIFATRIARAGGDTADLKKVKGQSNTSYNKMKNAISTKNVNGIKWNTILADWKYSDQNKATKKRWRQIFLYGMALHTATDAFAHNSCCKDASGNFIRISNTDIYHNKEDDNRTIYPNRWKCAKNTAYFVAKRCKNSTAGQIKDFSSKGLGCWKGFYMGNILKYAEAVNGGTDADLTAEFKAVNCSF